MSNLELNKLSEEQLNQLLTSLTPKTNKYIPITPTPKQTAALLMNDVREMLYGGASRRRKIRISISSCTTICRCSGV